MLQGHVGKHAGGLLLEQCRACGEDEDPVSMSLTAVRRLMRRAGVRAHEVGKLSTFSHTRRTTGVLQDDRAVVASNVIFLVRARRRTQL
ncbi:MAG: hypothetical protein ACPGGD_00075 [Thalassolituus sp.]